MSLKVFHVIFVTVATLLALGLAYWAFTNNASPIFGYGSLVAAVALVIYGFWFIRKAKNIIV